MLLFFCYTHSFAQKIYKGHFSNGYTGATISFTVSKDGKWLQNITFDGYWRCGGISEKIKAGPDKAIAIKNGEVHTVITEPENGGSSAFRFSLDGTLNGNKASGTFRMNINALSCDTYLLRWSAMAK